MEELLKNYYREKKIDPRILDKHMNELTFICLLKLIEASKERLGQDDHESIAESLKNNDLMGVWGKVKDKYTPEELKVAIEKNITPLLEDYITTVTR